MLKSKLVATLAVTASFGVGAASAADLAARPYTNAPLFV
jgi:outer membrane immunogenic protein